MLKINKVYKKNKKEKIKHLPSKQAVEGSNPSAFTEPTNLVGFLFLICLYLDGFESFKKKKVLSSRIG